MNSLLFLGLTLGFTLASDLNLKATAYAKFYESNLDFYSYLLQKMSKISSQESAKLINYKLHYSTKYEHFKQVVYNETDALLEDLRRFAMKIRDQTASEVKHQINSTEITADLGYFNDFNHFRRYDEATVRWGLLIYQKRLANLEEVRIHVAQRVAQFHVNCREKYNS